MATSAAVVTVATAPMGASPAPSPLLFGSMSSCTWEIRLLSVASMVASTMHTSTVLAPRAWGKIRTRPTPGTDRAQAM